MTSGEEPQARVGARIEARALHGTPARCGEVLEVIGTGEHERYRVRWDDGHESIVIPADGVAIVQADRRAVTP